MDKVRFLKEIFVHFKPTFARPTHFKMKKIMWRRNQNQSQIQMGKKTLVWVDPSQSPISLQEVVKNSNYGFFEVFESKKFDDCCLWKHMPSRGRVEFGTTRTNNRLKRIF